MIKRIVLAVVLVATLGLVSGCDPKPTGGSHQTQPTKAGQPQKAQGPPPWAANLPRGADPAVERPGPEADPNACNATGERDIELYAAWASETKSLPSVSWSKNGASTPATNLLAGPLRNGLKGYEGEWGTLVRGKCHDVFTVSIKGTPSSFNAICMIVDLGDGPLVVRERDCVATYTVV